MNQGIQKCVCHMYTRACSSYLL